MSATAEAAYLAGIIDGEGSISMGRNSRKTRWRWRIIIIVVNCNRKLIEWLHKEWGGSVLFDIDKGLNRRPQHRWVVTSNAARRVISAAMPFLIIKRERAGWATEVLKIQKGHGGRNYTKEIRVKLLEIHSRFVSDRKRTLAARK